MDRPTSTAPPRSAHRPERTCVGCRRRADPDALVRVVRDSDATLGVGRSSAGRGAWLCAGSTQCFDVAAKRQAFSRALRATVDAAAIAELRRGLFSPSGQHVQESSLHPSSPSPASAENEGVANVRR